MDLGIAGEQVGGRITGQRVVSGIKEEEGGNKKGK